MAALYSPRSARGQGSARLAPLFGSNVLRPGTVPNPPAFSQLRGGGRLYTHSPLEGYSEEEMIQEARLRMEHNKQRQRLKKLLNAASAGTAVVKTDDLMLACQLAKMPIDPNTVRNPSFQVDRGEIAWKRFHQSIEYPNLKGAGAFGELAASKVQMKRLGDWKKHNEVMGTVNQDVVRQNNDALKLIASDEEVYNAWKQMKDLISTRFAEIRRAFRLIDTDSSGDCDRDELKHMLNAMFNLNTPDYIMDRIIDMADFDGNGTINFAEFARLLTADNVLKMKKTIVADPTAWGTSPNKELDIDYTGVAAINRKMQGGGYEGKEHAKLRRTGPGIEALRRAHATYKKAIMGRYGSLKEAFQVIDADGSGFLRRAELRRFLRGLSKSIPDRVISALIDFCDADGDAKTLSIQEFVDMISAETLGAGGYDPQAAAAKLRAEGA